MADNPAYSFSGSKTQQVHPLGRETGQAAQQRLQQGLNTAGRTFQQHYQDLPQDLQSQGFYQDIPYGTNDLFPQGFDINQQMQHAREQPMAQALNVYRDTLQGMGNVAPSNAFQKALSAMTQQRAQAQGESSAQGYLKGLLPTISSHLLGQLGLQLGQQDLRLKESLGRMQQAGQLYASDAGRIGAYAGPLVELVRSRPESETYSYSRGPSDG